MEDKKKNCWRGELELKGVEGGLLERKVFSKRKKSRR